MHTENSSAARILVGKTKSGSEWYWYPDRHRQQDMEIMVQRLQHFGGVPTLEALQMIGLEEKFITIKTPAQSELLGQIFDFPNALDQVVLGFTCFHVPAGHLVRLISYLNAKIQISKMAPEWLPIEEREKWPVMHSLLDRMKADLRQQS